MGIKPAEHADEKAGQKCKELKERSGKEFDTAFLEHMSRCHDKSIALYEAGKKVAKAESVVACIDKTLPVLKVHTATIRQLHIGTRPDAGAAPANDNPQPGTKR